MTLFENRMEALEKLLAIMPIQDMKKENWEVLTMSENGIKIALGIADAIDGGLDFIFTEPICSPVNKDCWIAVVGETKEIVINHFLSNAFGITIDYIYGEAKRKYDEKILSYLYKYRQGAPLKNMRGRNVLLVDDGADTGLTMMVCLKTIFSMSPSKVAVALPVIPENLAAELYSLIDYAYLPNRLAHYVEGKTYYKAQESVDSLSILSSRKKRAEKKP